MSKRIRALPITFVIAALVAACGGEAKERPGMPPDYYRQPSGAEQANPGATPVEATGAEEVQATIGSGGGVLRLRDGVLLEVPAGTLAEPVEVLMSFGAESQALHAEPNSQAISPMLLIQPPLSAAPGKRFVISVPFAGVPAGFEEADLALAIEEADREQRALQLSTQTRWQYHPVKSERSRIKAEVSELPGMRVQFVVAK